MRFREALRTGICAAILAGASMIAVRVEAQAYQRRLDPTIIGPEANLINALLAAVHSWDEPAFSRLVTPNAKLIWLGSPTGPLRLPALRALLDRCILKSSDFGSWQTGSHIGPLLSLECELGVQGRNARTRVAMYIELEQGRIRGIRVDMDPFPLG